MAEPSLEQPIIALKRSVPLRVIKKNWPVDISQSRRPFYYGLKRPPVVKFVRTAVKRLYLAERFHQNKEQHFFGLPYCAVRKIGQNEKSKKFPYKNKDRKKW